MRPRKMGAQNESFTVGGGALQLTGPTHTVVRGKLALTLPLGFTFYLIENKKLIKKPLYTCLSYPPVLQVQRPSLSHEVITYVCIKVGVLILAPTPTILLGLVFRNCPASGKAMHL